MTRTSVSWAHNLLRVERIKHKYLR